VAKGVKGGALKPLRRKNWPYALSQFRFLLGFFVVVVRSREQQKAWVSQK